MIVLVIDTALGACTAAVFDGARPLAVRSEPMTKGHSERLGGFVRDAMAEAGIGFEAVERIGVTVGPGSFTGLRVGLAFALGIGEALDRPVVGVSALDALAASVSGDGSVAALIDARRDQVYARLFRDGAPQGEAEALPLATAAARLADGDWRLVGSGGPVVVHAYPQVTAGVEALPAPSPAALARLTIALDPEAHPPRPLYLRAPDATAPTRLPGQPRQAVVK
jgi:tRNA threonylcarbamoyladenosine biosynthesis protein TsaB